MGAVIVFARLWNGMAFDDGGLVYSGAWSGKTTVAATYLGNVDAVCDEPRRGGGGPDVPVVAGLCDLQFERDGLQKTEFAYAITLRGVTPLDDAFVGLAALQVVSIMIGVCAMARLLWSGARRRPLAGVAWMPWVLAACVAVGGVLTPYLVHRLEQAVIERFVPSAAVQALIEPISSGPGAASLFTLGASFVLAELWRRGVSTTTRRHRARV